MLPYVTRIFAALADSGVPRIHFATGNPDYFNEDLARYRALTAADVHPMTPA